MRYSAEEYRRSCCCYMENILKQVTLLELEGKQSVKGKRKKKVKCVEADNYEAGTANIWSSREERGHPKGVRKTLNKLGDLEGIGEGRDKGLMECFDDTL